MAKYVDGFVLVVPKDKTKEYKKMAEGGRDIWMKHGALGYYECLGNDLKPQEMGDEKLVYLQKWPEPIVMRQYGFHLSFLSQKNTAMKSIKK